MSVEPPLMSPGALSILGSVLADASAKPRNRSEWQARFAFWAKAESASETQRIEAAKRRVSKALARSQFLTEHPWTLVPQGSWHNRTNVRGDSDVDLCVCLTDSYFYDPMGDDTPSLTEIGLYPLAFTFQDFKNEVERCLVAQYGRAAVDRGGKALHLHKDDVEYVSVDVVPTFTFRVYGPRAPLGRGILATGVALLTDQGVRVTNFPEQHLENGRVFNEETGRRFKKVVRILKRMRNHMAANPDVPEPLRSEVRKTPSFLIECLVYNCPAECFGHSDIYDDVVAVLTYLQGELSKPAGRGLLSIASWQWWNEVNRQKSLFGPHQPTTPFQARGFVAAARTYMGA